MEPGSRGYGAILFDLDGTLTDSREGIVEAFKRALDRVGIAVGDDHDWTPYLGPPLRVSFERLHGIAGDDLASAVETYREYYQNEGMYAATVYAGIPELLSELRASGARLAVATSKRAPLAEQMLDHFGLAGLFDHIGGARPDASGDVKAGVVASVLDELAIGPACSRRTGVVMVGDREHDVHGAGAHGVDTIGVAWGYAAEGELDAAGAVAVAATVGELADLLLG